MEKAILVYIATNIIEKREAEESIAELANLAAAAGAQVVRKIFQVRNRISPKYFIGEGKVAEISQAKDEVEADLVIFDHNLTPTQQKGLENKFQTKVIDRTQLILDIFAQRAHSNEGKLQVELAQLNYLLPRLTGRGIALSQQGAGIGTRGPGEKKLEEDRRRIVDRISKIKKDIQGVQKRRANQRKSRKESPAPTVSLVGYTSAGKSTLFNHLCHENMLTSPQLFATLDPVLRRVPLSEGLYFFLTDTVGFIKKLPVELISSFRATLEEIKEADCICHVIDITSPHTLSQTEAVEHILSEIGASEIPVLKVFNKIDLVDHKEVLLAQNDIPGSSTVYISAKTGEGIPALKEKLRAQLFNKLQTFYLQVPKDREEIIASLAKWSWVLKKRENGDYFELKVLADPRLILPHTSFLAKGEENW